MKHLIHTEHYINGQWVTGQGEALTSFNPADGQEIWQGRIATQHEIKEACMSANHALISWRSLDFASRANYIINFSKQVEMHHQELAQIICKENGKPIWEALTEVASVIAKTNISIKAYQERTSPHQNTDSHLRFKPHGVVVVLGAFNFPAHLSNGHIIPALLAGNTIVYKPSDLTPAVAAFIMQCWHDANLPAGVMNCIQGNANTAQDLLNQTIQGVYFTGSYQTGVKINQQFAHRPEVILALEMGGNNPLVIDQIKNISAAVYHTILSSFITSGQRCTCARRLIIPKNSMGDAFLESFLIKSAQLKIGCFTDTPEPFMGPVISYQHALEHLQTQKKLEQLGGQSLLTMKLIKENTGFISPGVIDMTNAQAFDEEIFAPFVQVYRYDDFEHALILANQTRYGLSAGLFSDDNEHYKQFYQTIRAGLINWNKPTTGASSDLPFGGVGYSGNHRPSAYFAADYCAYPIASQEQSTLTLPQQALPGIT